MASLFESQSRRLSCGFAQISCVKAHYYISMTNFSERSILITGAASGLGRGIALALAQHRYRLILADMNPVGLEETRDMIGDAVISQFVVDMSNPADMERFVSQLKNQSIDVVINNAGVQHVSRLEEFPAEQWDRLLDVMLRAPFVLMQTLLPGMRARGFGRFINIGSIHSLVGSPFKSAYVAAKHGLVGLSKVAALETGDAEITINTICPSYVLTPLVEKQIKSQAQTHGISEQEVIDKIMLEPMPKKRFISIEEIAGTIEFLISEHAKNIAGQTIVIDGGWTAR